MTHASLRRRCVLGACCFGELVVEGCLQLLLLGAALDVTLLGCGWVVRTPCGGHPHVCAPWDSATISFKRMTCTHRSVGARRTLILRCVREEGTLRNRKSPRVWVGWSLLLIVHRLPAA